MQIKVSELKQLTESALQKQGYGADEVGLISDVLLYAQLRGNNQGVVKLIGKGLPKSSDAKAMRIIKETKLSALIDGEKNQGIVVMTKALEMVLSKVREYGFGIVGTNNTYSSTGAIGYYAQKIAEAGYIGFVFAGSPETVATHGSYEPLFGTNPLAIGVPTETEPIVLDMATSAMAYFGLVQASTAGQSILGDIAYDEVGNLTTDPTLAMDGAIRPFDRSYKGAGLAFMNEVLTGPLVGAAFVGIGDRGDWGNLIYAIDPEILTDKTTFVAKMSQMATKVKSAKKLPGVTEILLPGERGNQLALKNVGAGNIEVEDNLLDKLRIAAA